MKAKTVDKRGWSCSSAFFETTRQEFGVSLGKECYNHLYIILRETKQAVKEVRRQELSTELSNSRSVAESRSKNKDSEVVGGCCFPLRLSLHIRLLDQGEYLGDAGLISSLIKLTTHKSQGLSRCRGAQYCSVYSIHQACHFYMALCTGHSSSYATKCPENLSLN